MSNKVQKCTAEFCPAQATARHAPAYCKLCITTANKGVSPYVSLWAEPKKLVKTDKNEEDRQNLDIKVPFDNE